MSESNQRTIETYNARIDEYVATTPHEVSGDIQEWIDRALQGLSPNASVLELGSAFGRDADYIESLGHSLDRSDASQGFVDLLHEAGHEASLLNAITDDIPSGYDVIFANAVLLHFPRGEATQVMTKVQDTLNSGGKFVFSVKLGEGEGWSSDKVGAPRYFCYWQADELNQALQEAGFAGIDITNGTGVRQTPWLHVIAEKQK